MKTFDVIQGSPEWFAARLGIPTASEFDKIITAGGKASKQSDGYSNRLLAEIMTGKPIQAFEGNAWTERGKELEPEAVRFYELQKDCEALQVGFCTDDLGTMGASPDRLVGDDGLLEIKCPAPHTHVEYLLKDSIDREYYPQIQGQLLVTGRKWVDIISYHPEMRPVIIRISRDEEFISSLSALLADFIRSLNSKRALLVDRGYIEPERLAAE